jgi:uncharacterized RDD family membrane protein YckC
MRTRRSIAFIVDAVLITVLMGVAAVAIFVLGIVTLGLGWLLYFILWPAIAIIYYAVSLGGGVPQTPGMQFVGIELRMWYGEKPDLLIGIAHPILFYLSVTFLTPFIVLVALLSAKKRLLHDIVLGTVVMDSAALRQLLATAR